LSQFERRFKNLNTRSKKTAPLRAVSRRMEILGSAALAIRALGWRRAGMRQIAQAAGISAGNLYYYFKNKEELLYVCQELTLDALLEVAREAKLLASASARLSYIIHGHLRCLLDPRMAGPVHLEIDDLPASLRQRLVRKRDRYERAVRDMLADGQETGQVRRGDAKLQAFALLGALNWSARWYRPEGAVPVNKVAENFSEQLLRGLVRG
jgi:AcrR family transcriptional regulator